MKAIWRILFLILLLASPLFFVSCRWFTAIPRPPADLLTKLRDARDQCAREAGYLKRVFSADDPTIRDVYRQGEDLYEQALSAYETWIGVLQDSIKDETNPKARAGYEANCALAAKRTADFLEYVRSKLFDRTAPTSARVGTTTLRGGAEDSEPPAKKETFSDIGYRVVKDVLGAREREKEKKKKEAIDALEQLKWKHFREL